MSNAVATTETKPTPPQVETLTVKVDGKTTNLTHEMRIAVVPGL